MGDVVHGPGFARCDYGDFARSGADIEVAAATDIDPRLAESFFLASPEGFAHRAVLSHQPKDRRLATGAPGNLSDGEADRLTWLEIEHREKPSVIAHAPRKSGPQV